MNTLNTKIADVEHICVVEVSRAGPGTLVVNVSAKPINNIIYTVPTVL